MILRGSQLSERRLVLPLGATGERVPAPDKSAKVEPLISTSVANATRSHADPVVVSVVEKKENALTFESVVAWLAVQDAETRNGCAAILATELTKVYENAKNDGFAAGKKSGEQAAKVDVERTIGMLQQIAVNAQQAFDDEMEQLQDMCVEVVGEALAKIAGPLLATETASIGAIREVLSRVKEARELVIRVSSDDIELVRKLERSLSDLFGNRKYEFVIDSRVELGGCIVETKLGSLDGRLEVQLRELYETLRLAKLSTRELT